MSEKQQSINPERAHRLAEDEAVDQEQTTPENHVDADKLKKELDDIMDEIDEVLESNPAQFVSDYIQKGGE